MRQNQLQALSALDAGGIASIKEKVLSTAECAKKILSPAEQQRFLRWQPGPGEVLVNTDYAALEGSVTVPAALSQIHVRAAGTMISCAYTITHAVLRVASLYLPCGEIEPGHSYLCVLRFCGGIPKVLEQLPVFGDDRLPDTLEHSLLLRW